VHFGTHTWVKPHAVPDSQDVLSSHCGAHTPLEHAMPALHVVATSHLGSQMPFQQIVPAAHGAWSLQMAAHCLLMLHILPEPHDSPLPRVTQFFASAQDGSWANSAMAAMAAIEYLNFVVVFMCSVLSYGFL
jgi:hypothetical protein